MTENVHHLPWCSGTQLPSREQRDWITSAELVDEAQVTYRQVDYWSRTGLITPLEKATPGSGYMRRFSAEQIDRTIAISHLLNAGVALFVIRDVIDDFVEHGSVRIGAITFEHHLAGDAS